VGASGALGGGGSRGGGDGTEDRSAKVGAIGGRAARGVIGGIDSPMALFATASPSPLGTLRGATLIPGQDVTTNERCGETTNVLGSRYVSLNIPLFMFT
jgi:hypothetical protein